MSMGINLTIIQGNLVADPERIANDKGAKFRLAYSDKWEKDGEKHERTHFVTVKVWGNQANPVMEYLEKGKPVIVSGKLEYEEWEKDGDKKSMHVVNAQSVQFLPDGKKREE